MRACSGSGVACADRYLAHSSNSRLMRGLSACMHYKLLSSGVPVVLHGREQAPRCPFCFVRQFAKMLRDLHGRGSMAVQSVRSGAPHSFWSALYRPGGGGYKRRLTKNMHAKSSLSVLLFM